MRIISRGETKLVGIRLVCSTIEEYQEKIPSIVESLHNRLDEISYKVNSNVFIGIHMVDAMEEQEVIGNVWRYQK
ncbi:hypothetical protein [Virgibacillus ndiopensis]|uniref:hypothetical protein n=1 Tax=Virgibacillus ndiopensis TaxID=2004408 RepID=UPI000C06FC32|nr:hypothetical protein [Virgibacillus ndiopensis]